MREYTYLDDDRFFTFPPYPGREGAIPDRYRLDAETEFWVDPTCCRISTSEKDFYIQMVRELRPKSLDQFLFIGIGGRRILFSGPNGTTLPTQMRLDEQRRVVWEIGGIGHELRFYTGHHDHLSGTHRPFADRRQILAKDTKFAT